MCDNPFNLVLYDEDDEDGNVLDKKKQCEATKEIKAAVKVFVKDLKRIARKYKECGLGDTSTDESITEYIYERIHYDD